MMMTPSVTGLIKFYIRASWRRRRKALRMAFDSLLRLRHGADRKG